MQLTQQEQDIVRKKFGSYCIKVLDGEARNYFGEMNRLREREVNFSEMQEDLWMQLKIYDDFLETEYFPVLGLEVSVKNEDISAALRQLPEKKRLIILMAFFLDMTEKEIAECLHLVQSTVHYHKADSLSLLRKLME